VDRVQPIEARGLAGFFAAGGQLDPVTADYFARFDIILSYLFDPDLIFQTNVRLCSRAQFIAGPHRPNEAERIHATQVFLQPLQRLAIFEADPVPRLKAAPACLPAGEENLPAPGSGSFENPALGSDAQAARRLEASATIALHPGSGSEKKNWPEANWAALMRRIVDETPARLLLVGGEAEGDRLARLARPLAAARVEIARSIPLTELAGRLQHCTVFIGHDSGISHLAASLGLPTLALWGGSVEAVWRPQGRMVAIVRAEGGLAAIGVAQVWDELAAFFK